MPSHLYIWNAVSINRSSRPILEDGEYIAFVKDKVGLYQGQQKILNRQVGRLYLTNRRIIYVDEANPTLSMSIPISRVLSAEVIDGFLRSSAKVRISFRPLESEEETAANKTQSTNSMIDWVCQICSFNNHLLSNVDLDHDFPNCISCGIPPLRLFIEEIIKKGNTTAKFAPQTTTRDDQCPKCTFINHPSLRYCELCGCELKSSVDKSLQRKLHDSSVASSSNIVDDGNLQPHLNIQLENRQETYSRDPPYIKLSFRAGGEVSFQKHIIDVLAQHRWSRLEEAGAINQDAKKIQPSHPNSEVIHGGGIHGLEQIGQQTRKQNATVLSDSLEDLDQLLNRAQDLIKLSIAFQPLIKNKLQFTQIVPPLRIKKSSGLYHRELARHISEYCINGPLSRKLSMLSASDLFANYNRYLVMTQGFGLDLMAPGDLEKVLELTLEMKLPIKVKRYEKSGLIVVCPSGQATLFEIKDYLIQREREIELERRKVDVKVDMGLAEGNYIHESFQIYTGFSANEVADSLNWSYSVALEELEAHVSSGDLVIDNSILGTFYFVNRFSLPKQQETYILDEQIWKEIQKDMADEQQLISKTLVTTTHGIRDTVETKMSDNTMRPNLDQSFDLTLNGLQGLKF